MTTRAFRAIHPMALKHLAEMDYPIEGLRSKSWDDAAGDMCPVWPGQPITAHWGIADPVVVEGADWACERAFATAFRYRKQRISAFTALPFDGLERASLTAKLWEIGHTEGASSSRPNVA